MVVGSDGALVGGGRQWSSIVLGREKFKNGSINKEELIK
jgi:hypothetical protein